METRLSKIKICPRTSQTEKGVVHQKRGKIKEK
jgi:hypothetical protein